MKTGWVPASILRAMLRTCSIVEISFWCALASSLCLRVISVTSLPLEAFCAHAIESNDSARDLTMPTSTRVRAAECCEGECPGRCTSSVWIWAIAMAPAIPGPGPVAAKKLMIDDDEIWNSFLHTLLSLSVAVRRSSWRGGRQWDTRGTQGEAR